ncbi:subtilisin inhibitor CLSI-I-like [Phalaenopsis equestris]|uniref:subtilisin inhibitor CLSI-I-like n=1 Tax=Phalaenopsis equestris TaxID=78828 RepID=UPI0009E5A14B|nr:subtilisin inhibitor CLSI-I-like [Phalaenopsis equestris]
MDQETNHPANKESEGETTSGLRSWPEVVGLTAEEAEKRIKEDDPKLRLQVVGPDRCVTADFVTDRVWIFVDSEGKVIRTPTIG